MTCDRCKDIHKAQIEGRTQRECGCSCHRTFYTGTGTITSTGNTANNIQFWTDSGASTGLNLSGNEVF